MKVPIIAGRAFPTLILRRAFGNRHLELVLALLTFILPRVIFKYIPTRAERGPGRSFHNIGAVARRAMKLRARRRNIRDCHVEDIPTLLA
jgi:hypothetical protein